MYLTKTRITDKHVFFYGGVFSQWHKCSFKIKTNITIDWGGHTFNCAEQAMMYAKAKLFNDSEMMDKIMKADNPKTQKSFGRKVKNFDPFLWDREKTSIVVEINVAKFLSDRELTDALLKTGDRDFVEASPVDRIWGIGCSVENALDDKSNWRGQNLLGRCLNKARAGILEAGSFVEFIGKGS
jgi:ribA/ribD-fused uncharacterized protein